MKKGLIALLLLTFAAVFFSAGYFAGRAVGGDISVTVEQVSEDRTLPESDKAGLTNINTAADWQLMALPGVGEVLAGRIIEYREKNGAFLYKEEIMNVQGVGEALFDKIRGKITV